MSGPTRAAALYRRHLPLVLAALVLVPAVASAGPYAPTGETCGGLPKVAVETIDGVCIGIVLQRTEGLPLVKPRKIAQVAGQDAFLLTDMGGWDGNVGSLYLIERRDGSYAARRLRGELNLPHQILRGPGGRYYLGEAHRIISFRLGARRRPVDWRTVVDGLPDLGDNLHPLTHFIFLANGDLLINVGAATDACAGEMDSGVCRARESNGLLRRYRYLPANGAWSPDYEIFATGLRNSMALVQHPSGTILQAENGVDFKPLGTPYEEINVVERGDDFGWPYCHDNDATHPRWGRGAECRSEAYKRPWTLMPPHTAPLDMIYYTGDLMPALQGKLLISWHGYRAFGHRVVAYDVDEQGRPLRGADATFWSDPTTAEPRRAELFYTPDGSAGPVSQHIEITTAWNRLSGIRPRGAPVGLLEAEDGSLWIVDDKNRAVLRMAPGAPWRFDPGRDLSAAAALIQDPALAAGAQPVLSRRCQACHEFLKGVETPRLAAAMARAGWLSTPLAESKLATVLDARSMPPDKQISEAERARIRDWFVTLRPE